MGDSWKRPIEREREREKGAIETRVEITKSNDRDFISRIG
jgi:hypothetical protein